MISPDYVRLMARYGAWQNERQLAAMETLDDAALRAERGAFFGSILATANHLLWADRTWLHRFAGTPKPHAAGIAASTGETADLAAFRDGRRATDAAIRDWAEAGVETAGTFRWYSGAAGREVEKPRARLLVHFFNHATHHRGQIHAMLTAAGAAPSDTDLFLMPDD